MKNKLNEIIAYNTLAISILIIAFVIVVVNPSFFISISVEDGIVEWISSVSFLIACVLFIVSAFKSNKIKESKHRGAAMIMLICFGLFCFLCFGEEISWGQRIFGFELSEENRVSEYHKLEGAFQNIQNETNLHNMGIVERVGNRVIIVGIQFIMAFILPLLNLTKPFSKLFKKLYFPVPSFAFSMFFFGGVILIATKLVYNPEPVNGTYIYDKVNEFSEMMMSFGFLLFALKGIVKPDSTLN